jgi:hypothetical protein
MKPLEIEPLAANFYSSTAILFEGGIIGVIAPLDHPVMNVIYPAA